MQEKQNFVGWVWFPRLFSLFVLINVFAAVPHYSGTTLDAREWMESASEAVEGAPTTGDLNF
jgi:hypothetical protein